METFLIKYDSGGSSPSDVTIYEVREIDGEDYHYFISDGGSHIGGGRLLKKYCKKIEG